MKHLLTALAIVSSIGFAMPALAAPAVLSKKQLPMPSLPSAILRQLSQKSWIIEYSYPAFVPSPTKHASSTLRNVSIKPQLTNDLLCGDTNYRAWHVEIDPAAIPAREGYRSGAVNTYMTFEAIRNGKKTYVILENRALDTFFGCAGSSIIIRNPYYAKGTVGFHELSFDTFQDNRSWTDPKATRTSDLSSTVWVNGITQDTGYLTVKSGNNITGDSRIIVAGKQGLEIHTVPWYRDLRNLSLPEDEGLYIEFMKANGGYSVTENRSYYEPCATSTDPKGCYKTSWRHFFIHDGEAQYTEYAGVQSPLRPEVALRENGMTYSLITYYTGDFDAAYGKPERILLHGIPASAQQAFNNMTSLGWIVQQDDGTAKVRYVLTNNGRPEYWEATVQR